MRITEKELERITDFQKHNNLEHKTTEEIITNYFVRCDNCDELVPEIYTEITLGLDLEELKICPECYEEICIPELSLEDKISILEEEQRDERHLEAMEQCGK